MPTTLPNDSMFKTEDYDGFDRDVSMIPPRVVVPLLQQRFPINSVVDIGCGPGMWLAAFAEAGIKDIRGYDGHYIQPHQLLIPAERFQAHDLAQPLDIGRSFDLACCLEVAEHLPEARELSLVEMLTNAAPVVLFSAGIPGQPGQGHINLKWQSHWARLFAARGYTAYDIIRPEIWGHDDIYWWYQQNVVVYARTPLAGDPPAARIDALDVVHPALYEQMLQPGGRRAIGELVRVVSQRAFGG